MKDNLLFVNRSPEEIKEFQDAMKDETFGIDTADSGLEAAALLKKNTYKVVITGMNLSTFDGMKLLAYLNQYCPQTICIVYTTRIDLAQLRLLVNERDVFRIFLKPVNYRGDFRHAVMDGFTYYDIRSAENASQEMIQKKRENAIATVAQMEEAAGREKKEREQLSRFLMPMVRASLLDFGPKLSEKDQQKLLECEEIMMQYFLKNDYKAVREQEEIEPRLREEMITGTGAQSLSFEVKGKSFHPDPGFYEMVHFLIWLSLKQMGDMSDSWHVEAVVHFKNPVRVMLQIRGEVPEGIMEDYQQQEIAGILFKAVKTMMENMSDKCRIEMERGHLSCDIELRPKRK